jgi:hypothetical protein
MTRRNRRGRGYYTPQELPITRLLSTQHPHDNAGDEQAADDAEQADNAADQRESTISCETIMVSDRQRS